MQGSKLPVEIRRTKGKGEARRMRSQGFIPGICYGKGTDPVMLKVDPSVLQKALDEERRVNTVLELDIKGIGAPKEPFTVLIKDHQIDALTDELTHVDFFRVDDKTPVEVKVPLVLNGKAQGVQMGGFLQPVFFDLPVRCLPQSIPVKIEYEISWMDVGDIARVKDLDLDEGVTVLLDGQQGIASVISGKAMDAIIGALDAGGEEGEEAAEGEEGEGAEGREEGGQAEPSEKSSS